MESFIRLLLQLARLFIWWTIVAPWEQAIRVRFGKHKKLLGAGIHFRIPYFDVIYRQCVRLRMSPCPVQTLTTNDTKTIVTSATISYSVKDVILLYENLFHAEDTLRGIVMAAIAHDITTHGATECTPSQVADRVNASLSLHQFGLADVRVYILDFVFTKVYRLISDQKWGTAGQALNTDNPDVTVQSPSVW